MYCACEAEKDMFLQSPAFLSVVERRRVKHSSFHLHEENTVLLERTKQPTRSQAKELTYD
jgi:hypothetical protein